MIPDEQLGTDKEKELRAQYRAFLFQQNRIEDPRKEYKGDKTDWKNLEKKDDTLQDEEEIELRTKLRRFLKEEETEKKYQDERYTKLEEEYKKRLNDIEKINEKISSVCKKQYERWKNTATSTEKNQGIRDFEKMKRDEEFKRNEMRVMYEKFCEAANQPMDQLNKIRLKKEQFAAWMQAMNRHNKQHNRWVDEPSESEESKQGDKEKFIDAMYDIMNKQSLRDNVKNHDGTDKLDDEFQQFTVIPDQESVEGVSMYDYKRVMMPWIRKFTELKDNDHL